ncbi:WXG100 family type VII secretion target [Nocardioides sp. SYSU DS0663]|uniref:WXG100 family type VII secretion target n=1 Tax=Nocardioides sp. SYSU DS0663 TaxID=3416445 RepID=UPI003F4C428F
MNIELSVGQQTTAALTVQEAVTTFNTCLQRLSDGVASGGQGFRGNAAAAFGEALTAWFEAAAELGPALQQYAAALATVDAEHSHNEVAQVDSYARLGDRLGGAGR